MKINNHFRPEIKKTYLFNIYFLISIGVIYLLLFLALNKLQYSATTDEPHYWETSLRFSYSLIPSLELLRNYGELNTPLPFMMFGGLEYLFKGGIFAGRFLNFIISFLMTCLIGLPKGKVTKKSVLSVCGLLLFPYYLILSGRLYTDIIAVFFVFLGFWFYLRSQHILSSFAFILAIASRQFMLAFPLAIAIFELINYLIIKMRIYGLKKVANSYSENSEQELGTIETNDLAKTRINPLRWLMPLIASLSIVGWLLFFRGIAPEAGMVARTVPKVQQNLWSIDLSGSYFSLSCVGLYFVIPELILFRPKLRIQNLLTRNNIFFAAVLLLLFIIFPLLEAHGILIKVATILLPNDFLRLTVFYFLALITCLRFFNRLNLAFWLLLINCGLMMKAYPWDKYVLPLLIVFWYLKSINILDKKSLIKFPSAAIYE
ncbi:hypothetical protein IQ247_07680 [Plectonema cf. radiosum LEGE 06105]|uniref:Uncharacterized protein n=1 Tax=Plectonema cf. radiosum LEGE 06105 TaxID=945769 RepID=A0A8J7JZK7_9CYAN|nr:hypothetical protein [Plectonema radiosum]MBE9212596.1 hypothetical protein [Plectonema cf. radiosum LEGE 06105]